MLQIQPPFLCWSNQKQMRCFNPNVNVAQLVHQPETVSLLESIQTHPQ